MTKDVDAVISFQPNANIYATLARLLLLGSKKPKLFCGERTVTAHYRSAATRVGIWIIGLCSDNLVTNSYTQARVLRQLPGLADKVKVIWNGYRVLSSQTNSFMPKSKDQLRILVVGRQSSEKNGLRLLEALQVFYDRYGWTPQLRWAGRQEQDDASLSMKAIMNQFLMKYPMLATQCSFLGEVKDVNDLYLSSDVLILPSLYEGLPNAVCEAMLAGCPVIASNVCDLPRLLGSDGERGLLCDPLSSASIADAIYRFHTMPLEEKACMVQRARQFVKDNLSLEKMVKSYEALLEANSSCVY
jgi:glycosyltransferase involved in cell wall biosynthesis